MLLQLYVRFMRREVCILCLIAVIYFVFFGFWANICKVGGWGFFFEILENGIWSDQRRKNKRQR